MIVAFDGITFDNCFYDRDVDVLYLHNGPSTTAVDFDACPEDTAVPHAVASLVTRAARPPTPSLPRPRPGPGSNARPPQLRFRAP